MTIYFYLCVFAQTLQHAVQFWAYTSCFKLKVKAWIGYAVFLAAAAAVTFIKMYCLIINNDLMLPMSTLVLLTCFFSFHFLTEGSIWKKLILSLIDQLVVDTVIEFTLYIIAGLFFDVKPVLIVYGYEGLMAGISFCFLAAPIKYLLVKIWNKANKTKGERLNPVFLIFPVGQVIGYVVFQFERFYSEDLWGIDSLLITSVYFIVLALSDVVYIIFLSDIEKKNRLEREYNTLNYMRQIKEARYSAIEEKQIETAKIRHDIKNQLIVIKGLLKSGDSEEAAALIKELETDINASKEKEYCSVPVINALLFEKEKVCVSEGIAFESDIAISDTGRISKNHLCSIFSNLMDNAINECKNLGKSDRKIKIASAQKNGFISVQCENTAEEGKRGVIKPSESKGFGMKILQDIADRYNGSCKCEIDGGKCFSEIIVNIMEESN